MAAALLVKRQGDQYALEIEDKNLLSLLLSIYLSGTPQLIDPDWL
jgi:hypothetical protein